METGEKNFSIFLARINPKLERSYIDYFLGLTSEDTRKRFKNFRFIEDSLRTLYGDIIVRHSVMKALSVKNSEIKFTKNSYGKPYIKGLPVHFNISHSGDWVTCAISRQNVGIDIEIVKDFSPDIARRFFSPSECDFLKSRPESEWENTFFDLWTLKESYIKWLGTGLTTPLDSFSFKISNAHITVTDENCEQRKPYFKQYPVKGYKLSVCSSGGNFPQEISVINDIKELTFE